MVDGRVHEDADALLRLVPHGVRALRPRPEADDVPRLQHVASLRVADGRSSLEHEQPLLLAVLVVVRADRLARRQLVDRRPHRGGADERPEAEHAGAEAVRIRVVVLERGLRDVDALHRRSLSARVSDPAAGARTSCSLNAANKERPVTRTSALRRKTSLMLALIGLAAGVLAGAALGGGGLPGGLSVTLPTVSVTTPVATATVSTPTVTAPVPTTVAVTTTVATP